MTHTDPLSVFSGCHVGIIRQIKKLAEIPDRIKAKDGSAAKLAAELRAFFNDVIVKHHRDEEETLFVATREVLDQHLSEAFMLSGYIGRLTEEHRHLERLWGRVEPELKKLEKGKTEALSDNIIKQLSIDYLAHAQFEEDVFLPLSEKILSQHDKAGLGMMMHMRDVESDVRAYL